VYDITDRQSFTDLQLWLNEVDKHGKEDVVKILIGNKKDLSDKRQVTYE
jgi:Ras-related protein Rab-1A